MIFCISNCAIAIMTCFKGAESIPYLMMKITVIPVSHKVYTQKKTKNQKQKMMFHHYTCVSLCLLILFSLHSILLFMKTVPF